MVIKNGKHRLVGFVDLRELHEDMRKLEGKYSGPFSSKVPCPFIVNSNQFDFSSIPATQLSIATSLCHPQINLLQNGNEYTGKESFARLNILSFIVFFFS